MELGRPPPSPPPHPERRSHTDPSLTCLPEPCVPFCAISEALWLTVQSQLKETTTRRRPAISLPILTKCPAWSNCPTAPRCAILDAVIAGKRLQRCTPPERYKNVQLRSLEDRRPPL